MSKLQNILSLILLSFITSFIQTEIHNKFDITFAGKNFEVVETLDVIDHKFSLLLKEEEIAYIHCENFNNSYYIATLHVNQEFRSQNIGSFFLNFVCDRLIKNSAKVIYLKASPFNLKKEEKRDQMLPKLIKFYNKNGFIQKPKYGDVLYYEDLLYEKQRKKDYKLVKLLLQSNL